MIALTTTVVKAERTPWTDIDRQIIHRRCDRVSVAAFEERLRHGLVADDALDEGLRVSMRTFYDYCMVPCPMGFR